MKSFYFIALFAIFFGSCKVLHKNLVVSEVREEDRTEYYFSLIEAQKQMVLGNYSKAKALYLRCMEIEPKSAAVDFQLANLYITTGNYDLALDYSWKAFQLEKQNEWYILQLAQIFKAKNNLDSMIYCYQLLVKSKPKYDYKITLASLYLKANWLNLAMKLVNSIESEYGETYQTITCKYKVYILKNENIKCIRLLKDAIQKFPEETQYYGLLGEHFSTIGNYNSALENFTKLLRIEPANEKGYLSIIDLYRRFQKYTLAYDSAESFVNRKEFSVDNKIEMIRGLLSIEIDSVFSERVANMIDSLSLKNPDNVKVAILKADLYIYLRQYKCAEKQLNRILLTNKRIKIAWEKLAFVLSLNEDFDAMNKVCSEGINLFPDDALFYFYRGVSLFRLGSYQGAIQSLESGLNYSGDNKKLLIQINSLLGEYCNFVKAYDKSDSYFEDALKLDPNNFITLNNYSYNLARRGVRMNNALLYSKRCIKSEPDNVTFLDTYGFILFKTGKFRGAEKAFRKAIQLGGLSDKSILKHYIDILVMLNKKSEAHRYTEILLKLEADSSKANRSDK